MKYCKVNECSSEVHSRHMCEMHYRRVLRKGAIGDPARQRESRRVFKKTDIERFKDRLKIKECWEWQGAIMSSGYGEFQSNGKTRLAHRWSYEYHNGTIPGGLHIDHLCFNRICVNPEHLEAVTPLVNNRRAWDRRKALL